MNITKQFYTTSEYRWDYKYRVVEQKVAGSPAFIVQKSFMVFFWRYLRNENQLLYAFATLEEALAFIQELNGLIR